MYSQSPPGESRPAEVRAEGAAAVALVQTPAEVACQRHIEEDHLHTFMKENKTHDVVLLV